MCHIDSHARVQVCCSHTPVSLSIGPTQFCAGGPQSSELWWEHGGPDRGRHLMRDHDVALGNLIPCPLGPISEGLVGVSLIQGPTIV